MFLFVFVIDMDYKYIDQLLERYWQGQTTLEEETILRTFFSQADVPAELSRYRDLFSYQQQQVLKDVLDADFDERILTAIGSESAGESPKVKARVIPMSTRLAPLFKAAAVVAIILTLGNALQMTSQENGYYPPTAYDQPEQGASMAMRTDTSGILVDRLDTLSKAVIKE